MEHSGAWLTPVYVVSFIQNWTTQCINCRLKVIQVINMLFQNYESAVVQSYTCTESWKEFQSSKGILAMCSNVNLFMWLDMMDITCHLLGRYWLWRRNQNTRGTPNDVVVFIHWNHLTSILGSVTLKTRVNAPNISVGQHSINTVGLNTLAFCHRAGWV